MMRFTLLIIAAAVLAATPVSGQAAAPAPATPAAVTTPPNQKSALEPQGYDYKPSGRRDPFVSLVRRSTEALGTSANQRPTGKAGLSVDEIAMRGIMKGHEGWLALVRGVDNRTYTLKAGDELYDGTVKAVTGDAIVLLQNVSDPLSVQKKREIRKLLRPAQEAR
jgi:Tfp pilus assembly protein PilP